MGVSFKTHRSAEFCRRAPESAENWLVRLLVSRLRIDHVDRINELSGALLVPGPARGQSDSNHPGWKVPRTLIGEEIIKPHRPEIEVDGGVCMFGEGGGMVLHKVSAPVDKKIVARAATADLGRRDKQEFLIEKMFDR